MTPNGVARASTSTATLAALRPWPRPGRSAVLVGLRGFLLDAPIAALDAPSDRQVTAGRSTSVHRSAQLRPTAAMTAERQTHSASSGRSLNRCHQSAGAGGRISALRTTAAWQAGRVVRFAAPSHGLVERPVRTLWTGGWSRRRAARRALARGRRRRCRARSACGPIPCRGRDQP